MDQNHTERHLTNYKTWQHSEGQSSHKTTLAKSFDKSLHVLHSIFLPEIVVHVMIQSFWSNIGKMISIHQRDLRSLSACLKTFIAVA